MANPASLTLNSITENGFLTRPAAQTIDTDGTVPILADGDGHLMLLVDNADSHTATVTVKAGTSAAAITAGQGDLAIAMAATGTATDKRVIGPLETARFAQTNGNINLAFAHGSGGTTNLLVTVYRLPK